MVADDFMTVMDRSHKHLAYTAVTQQAKNGRSRGLAITVSRAFLNDPDPRI
jgi:hypothetical protein